MLKRLGSGFVETEGLLAIYPTFEDNGNERGVRLEYEVKSISIIGGFGLSCKQLREMNWVDAAKCLTGEIEKFMEPEPKAENGQG